MVYHQLHTLIQLAKVDGILSKDELSLIYKVAYYYGYSKAEVDVFFQTDSELPPLSLENLDANQRYECMTTTIQLMKVDDRLYPEEITFCREVAQQLGYTDEILYHCLLDVQCNSTAEGLHALGERLHKRFCIFDK